MSKIILSGDLGRFRLEMLVRILESIRADAILTLESAATGQITLLSGKVVGAVMPPAKGMEALRQMVPWNTGTFTVRDIAGTQTMSMVRSPDLMNFPDNAGIFRGLAGGRPPVAAPVPTARPTAAGPARPAPAARPPQGPELRGNVPQRPTAGTGPKIGPLAKVPYLTEKGRTAARSLQANFQRGAAVEGDKWRLLLRCNGEATLYQIGEDVQILGDRLLKAVKELQEEGLVAFESLDASGGPTSGNFKFGEYMVAKGHITQAQLESALSRQQDLARKGRYMWLGELLVELNYVRPGQVQEALAYQKRAKR